MFMNHVPNGQHHTRIDTVDTHHPIYMVTCTCGWAHDYTSHSLALHASHDHKETAA